MKLSPLALIVFPTAHQLLFVLLPLALAARMAVKPKPALLPMAQGAMSFCLGFGKFALLVSPLWHLSSIVSASGPESLGKGIVWMGFLSRLLSLHFTCTGIEDLVNGLGGLFGFKIAGKAQDALLTWRRVTQGKFVRWLAVLVILALCVHLLQATPVDVWLQMKAMFASPPRTVTSVLQEACVWTDFHVLTMLAALACFLGLPYSREFLRVPAVWKAVVCFLTFLLAVAMLWTHVAPMS